MLYAGQDIAVFPQVIRASLGHGVSMTLPVKLHEKRECVGDTQFCLVQSRELMGKKASNALISLGLQLPP